MRRTGRTSTRPPLRARSALPLLALILTAACGTTRAAAPVPDPAAAIRAMMDGSAEAWNRGDLDAFLSDYAEDASFVTGAGLVHGRDRVRDIYWRAWWRDGEGPEAALRYEDFDIRATGPETAVAFGRFILYDRQSGATTSTGTFSLTLRAAADGWEIVHDHSSADG